MIHKKSGARGTLKRNCFKDEKIMSNLKCSFTLNATKLKFQEVNNLLRTNCSSSHSRFCSLFLTSCWCWSGNNYTDTSTLPQSLGADILQHHLILKQDLHNEWVSWGVGLTMLFLGVVDGGAGDDERATQEVQHYNWIFHLLWVLWTDEPRTGSEPELGWDVRRPTPTTECKRK